MRIGLKNNPAEFHSDPIWNDGAFGFFEDGRVTRRKEQQQDE